MSIFCGEENISIEGAKLVSISSEGNGLWIEIKRDVPYSSEERIMQLRPYMVSVLKYCRFFRVFVCESLRPDVLQYVGLGVNIDLKIAFDGEVEEGKPLCRWVLCSIEGSE